MDNLSKNISILGSTGSIGVQSLEVAERLGCKITALASHSSVTLLENQIRKFKPDVAVMYDESSARDLKTRVADLDVKILSGKQGLIEAACLKTDILINSVVGMVGLEPTLAAAKAGNDIALANKETLVAGGKLVMDTIHHAKVKLIPVDSEHSAIFQCLQGALTEDSVEINQDKILKKIILTASGGPFFGKSLDELKSISVEDALKHPNWDMGAKISIDSATLTNKGLELIEAHWLFDVAVDSIDIVVHRESIIHSMIEFVDGSVLAQMGMPDMKVPIQYAMTYPKRYSNSGCEALELYKLGTLSFNLPDYETFKCLKVAKAAILKGGLYPAAVNSANEEAVKLFLERKISFLQIGDLVEEVLEIPMPTLSENSEKCLSQILEIDEIARDFVRTRV